MGLAEFVRKQFVDILQWTEEDDETLVWRFPAADLEIQQGAQLVVRETQAALFVDQGRIADLFGPGRHTIRTASAAASASTPDRSAPAGYAGRATTSPAETADHPAPTLSSRAPAPSAPRSASPGAAPD